LCAACRERLNPGEPVAWTIAKRRIHESCIGASLLVGSARKTLNSRDAANMLAAQFLCAACFALQDRISLSAARQLMVLALEVPGVRAFPVTCSSCGREANLVCDFGP
jgi:hypothetical protein